MNMDSSNFNPEDFLDLARVLLADTDPNLGNAKYRSSISRAYYAAFLKAREKCTDRGCSYGRSSDVHERVIKDVKGVLGDRTSGDFLRLLKELRTKADYDLYPNPNKKKVEEAIDLSDLVIGGVGSI